MYIIIAQEIGVTLIRLEIKKKKNKFSDKTIRTTGPTTWNFNKKQLQLIIFGNLSNHY